MAGKVSVIFTIVLSFLVLSQASVEIQKPENLVAQWNPSNDLPDSDAMSTIVLPTDTIQSYSEEIPNDRIVDSEPKDLPEFNTMDEISVIKPFAGSFDGSFRPINHHFHHMPLKHHFFRFRFPTRWRHHHHHHRFGKPMGPRFTSDREIPYGNDMIMSDQAKGPSFTAEREIRYGNDMIINDQASTFEGKIPVIVRASTPERDMPYRNEMIVSDQANFDPMSYFHHNDMRHKPSMMFPRRPFEDNNGFRKEDKMDRPHHHEEEDEEMERDDHMDRPHHHEEEDEKMEREDEMDRPHHHHHHHHEEEDEKMEREDEMDRPHHHHHHHHEEEDEKMEREDKMDRPHHHHHHEEEDEKEEGGFMLFKSFRKFLNDFKP
ncbi:hypothetical protein NE237_011637 [Protea cynaroides]|uniref:Uncharacterized protein n=1 Tax=Protea cynaroides TaxID=273540 RepID=A0A9Q0GWF9_9MAGN|nr:hypothetical protein NE237_011637 [Protea cynaroides]